MDKQKTKTMDLAPKYEILKFEMPGPIKYEKATSNLQDLLRINQDMIPYVITHKKDINLSSHVVFLWDIQANKSGIVSILYLVRETYMKEIIQQTIPSCSELQIWDPATHWYQMIVFKSMGVEDSVSAFVRSFKKGTSIEVPAITATHTYLSRISFAYYDFHPFYSKDILTLLTNGMMT